MGKRWAGRGVVLTAVMDMDMGRGAGVMARQGRMRMDMGEMRTQTLKKRADGKRKRMRRKG
jgi:hypothetical protein